MSRTPTTGIDYTSRDYEAFRELMIEKLQEKIPEYTDTSSTDVGIVILECLANGLDILSMYSDIIANDVLLPTTQDRRLAVQIAKLLGYTAMNQTASKIKQVFVLGEPREQDTVISRNTVVMTEESDELEPVYFETEEDLIIPAGCLGDEKDESGNYLYSVVAVQGSSVEDDLIGTSNGTESQSFKLSYDEVLTDSIELFVDEGNGFKLWKQVSSFIEYDETDEVYVVSVDEFDNCFVEFGTGLNGKIPAIHENGIIANYRIGGGSIGNVQANTVIELDTAVPFVDKTFNPAEPFILGDDKEDIDEIRYKGSASFRTRDRAVTLQDYADLLIINFYKVYNAVGIQDSDNATHVNLYYEMRGDNIMTEEYSKEIRDFFSTRQMIGCSYSLHPVEYHNLDLVVSVIIDNDYYKDEVLEEVDYYVKEVFFTPNAFEFGEEFYKSDLEAEIKDNIDGVKSFRITTPSDDIFTPEDHEIIRLNSLQLNATGGRERR